MKNADDEFYIGYLPKSPERTGRFTRRAVLAVATGALIAGVALAVSLPYLGGGRFEFGHPRAFAGQVLCGGAGPARLVTAEADHLLVSLGKHGAPVELCGATGTEVALTGTLIERDGRSLIELADQPAPVFGQPGADPEPVVPLGRFTLTGEIVDAKCYFGVMNPGEGRVHRACAMLCLRGGVPAVFVARDRRGGSAHLLLTGPDGGEVTRAVLPWVGETVEATGEVVRQGRWLVWRVVPGSMRLAAR